MSRPIPPSDAPRGASPAPPTGDAPLPPRDLPPGDPPPRRRGAGTLVWLLLLIALLAFGWYFYNQRGAVSPPVEPVTPIGIGSEQEAAAERERAAAEARDARPAPSAPTPAATADRDPQPLAAITPDYPPAAFRAREEGIVVVRAAIDTQGVPSSVEVESSSRSRELDRAAVDAVSAARFAPAIRRGQATAETVQVPVEFRLDQP